MAPNTAAAGRVQFPGGSVEPPPGHEELDEAGLRRQAVRELVEETGVEAAPEDLTLWALTRGQYGNIGVFFHARPQPESVVRQQFAALVAEQTTRAQVPELAEIGVVRSPAELASLAGPHVDYLEPLVRRYVDAPAAV